MAGESRFLASVTTMVDMRPDSQPYLILYLLTRLANQAKASHTPDNSEWTCGSPLTYQTLFLDS